MIDILLFAVIVQLISFLYRYFLCVLFLAYKTFLSNNTRKCANKFRKAHGSLSYRKRKKKFRLSFTKLKVLNYIGPHADITRLN